VIINKKMITDGGGSVGGVASELSAARKYSSPTQRLFRATFALYVDKDDGVRIVKNRFGEVGKVSTSKLVDCLSDILVQQVFEERMLIFQEGMKQQLKQGIKKIIKEGVTT